MFNKIASFTVATVLCISTVFAQEPSKNFVKRDFLYQTISQKNANDIAVNFINRMAQQYPIWSKSSVLISTPLYSKSNKVEAFEVQLVNSFDEPAGYIIVEADPKRDAIAEFSTSGLAPTSELERKIAQEYGYDISYIHGTFLWNGPGTSSLLWSVNNKDQSLLPLNPSVQLNDFSITRPTNILSGQKQLRMMRSMQSVEVDNIDWSFKPFYQEKRFWYNSTSDKNECYAGCTPIAAAMLIDFYDRNGFPHMIGDETQQDHVTSSPLMRETIDELRGYLRTYCRNDSQGGTPTKNSIKLVDYMNTRGHGEWSAKRINYSTLSTFFKIMNEIKNKRPALVHYHTRGQIGSNHSTVASGYIFGGFWSDNFLTIRTGWSTTPEIQYNINSMGTLSTTLVKKLD